MSPAPARPPLARGTPPFSADLALERAARLLAARLEALEGRLDADEGAWAEYGHLVVALAAIAPQLRPEARGALLTTAQMASRLGVAPKTLLKWRRSGSVGEPQVNGRRGRAALRWSGSEVAR